MGARDWGTRGEPCLNRVVTDFISHRPKDPEPSCSCTLRIQNRYKISLGGEEEQAEQGRKPVCCLRL